MSLRVDGVDQLATSPLSPGGRQIVGSEAPTVGGGGLTLLGKNTTEETTSATVDTDLVTVSGLNIAPGQPFIVEFDFRKTTGAAVGPTFGLKVNSTIVADTANSLFATMNATNQVESGHAVLKVGSREANYLRSAAGYFSSVGAGGNNANIMFLVNAAFPSVAITSITIRGNAVNALVTAAVKNLFIWAPPIV